MWALKRRADQQSVRAERTDLIIRQSRTGPVNETGPAIPVVDCGGSCAWPYDDLTGTIYYSALLQQVGISYYNAYDFSIVVGPTVTATMRDKALELFFRGRRVGIYRPYWFTDLIPIGGVVTLNGYVDPVFGPTTQTRGGPATRWVVSCGTAVGPASRPAAINVLSLTQTNDPNANDVAIIADFPQFVNAWTGGLERTALPRLPVYPTSDQRFSDVASWSSWTNTAPTWDFTCANKRIIGRYAWTANTYSAIGTQTTGTGTSVYFEQV